MRRAEKIGLGVAFAGHVLLFALLSVSFHPPIDPALYKPKPIEVSLAEDVALEAQAPKAVEPPAQSKAPDQGAPEDAAPPAPQPDPEPEPEKAPAPPKPQPKPEPPAKAPPKPEPAPVPKPKPAPVKAKPKPEKPPVKATDSKAEPKKAAAKPAPSKAEPKKAAAAPAKAETPPSKAKGTGSDAKSPLKRPRGSLLDDDFRKGLTLSPSSAKPSAAAPGATMNAQAAADIGSAIKRQVQPCALQQVVTGPGVSRIVVKVHLQINRDGSLAGSPTIDPDHGGVDDDNRRYVDAVDRAAIASFKGCAPLRGLPTDLYDVPHGWKSFTLRFKLPG